MKYNEKKIDTWIDICRIGQKLVNGLNEAFDTYDH